MQVKAQIKASILLGLFSLLLLHQTVPHSHHDHQEKSEHRVAKSSHGHSHSHEHEHKHGQEREDSKGFFSILLAIHSHTGSSTEVPVVEEAIQHILLKKVKTESFSPQHFLPIYAFLEGMVAELNRNYQPPPKYFDSYLSLLSLRGPPQLV